MTMLTSTNPISNSVSADPRIEEMLLYHEIGKFNTDYARALDQEKLGEWAEMFTHDALYVLLPRENFDRNLPVGLVYCENQGMIKDRAFALMETSMFAPRYLRHFISNLSVQGIEANGDIRATANYALIEVLFDRPDAKLHQVGVYYDLFRRDGGRLKLAERRCVYDSLLVSNAMCLPA